MKPVLLVGDIDLYAEGLIDKLPISVETKGLGRDKLFTDEININCKNFSNLFSVDNPKSYFYKKRWRYMPVKWWDSDNIVRWDGVLRDITRNHANKTATLKSSNILSKYLNTNIEYISTDWETPADAFKNICSSIDFDFYDNKTVEESINIYTENACYIKCYFSLEDDTTFQQALEKIADICAADIYGHNNKLHFKVYKKFSGNTITTISETDLRSEPLISYLESELINNYRIKYNGCLDIATTDADNNNIGEVSRREEFNGQHDLSEIDGQEGNQVVIKDKPSAVFIGEQAIKRTHYGIDKYNPGSLQSIKFRLDERFRRYIDINSYIRLNFSDEAWSGKLLEVFETSINFDSNEFNIMTVESEE